MTNSDRLSHVNPGGMTLNAVFSFSHKINPNETSFDTSQIAPEHELSLFPHSILSATSSVPATMSNELLQAIDLLGKYKTMKSIPSADPQILACEK